MMQLRIAFRNVFRNRRRTALVLFMVAGGFSSIILFQGFVHNTSRAIKSASIKGQYGHLQVARTSFWEQTAETGKEALLSDYPKLIGEIKKVPHVTYAGGRLNFSALISSGERSTTAMGLSFDLKSEREKLAAFYILKNDTIPTIPGLNSVEQLNENIHQGNSALSDEKPFQIIVGHLLARQLGLKTGDTLNILSFTFDNVINAIEVEVAGLFLTGLTEVDNTTFVIPLQTAQTLLDTQQAQKIVVGLDSDDLESTQQARDEIQKLLSPKDSTVLVKVWIELAKLYREVIAYYKVQNLFIEIIIVSLVFLGILNTLGMAVFERMGEIGTIRSLGFKNAQVVRQFLLEGAILGILGSLVGTLLAITLVKSINAATILLIIPGASAPTVIEIDLFQGAFIEAALMTIIASVIASVIPAVRASRLPVVEALKHNV